MPGGRPVLSKPRIGLMVGGLLAGLAAVAALISSSDTAAFTALRLQPRWTVMPGFGRQQALGPSQIEDLTEFVLALSSRATDLAAVERAIPLYESHCSACHGPAGKGDEATGTPDLTDDAWLRGGSRDEIRAQIWHGEDGRGPVRQAWWGEPRRVQ